MCNCPLSFVPCRGVGAAGLVTNPPGKSGPVWLEWLHGAIHALEGLIRGSVHFAVFMSMLEMGKRSLEVVGVPSRPATPMFWNHIFLNLPFVRAWGSFLPVVLHCSGIWSEVSHCSHGGFQKCKGLIAPAQVLTLANCWEASLCRVHEQLMLGTWVWRSLWMSHPQFCIRKM